MKKLLTFACAIAVGVALSSNSFADITSDLGAGGTIPDNDPDNPFISTITVNQSETITDVDVNLIDASHEWIGDLIVQVTSPAGTTADIMFRTGSTTPGGFGDTSDLDGNYTFSDGGMDWWEVAGPLGGNAAMPEGTYEASGPGIANSNPPRGEAVSLAALFAGEDTRGDWTLLISDNGADSFGSLGNWSLFITSSATAIPEPGSMTLLGLMGVACIVRRRR